MGEAARQAGGAGLEVRLLGPLEVRAREHELTIGGPKLRALLAVLALDAGRVVSADRLVEALWPGEPPDTAAHAVQVYVSQLRKALGGEAIATRVPGYVLALDAPSVDAHRFARLAAEGRIALQGGDTVAAASLLREALALWRGPALSDFTYEPFAQGEIARLDELRQTALEERLEADLALGRHAELVSELEALVDGQPLRERPWAQLMLALYRSGRQADALSAYRKAREVLVEELGIEPGPALKELEASVLRQDASLLLERAPPTKTAMQFRRLVAVLVADIVDSVALAGRVDVEALGAVLRRYFEMASAAVERHGGRVERYAGDAVLAVFGAPVSHEDDALRAARAALDLRTSVAALEEQLGVGLQIRIGLEAGEVVSAETEGTQRLVTGQAVGIAARLEQAAEPGAIVVGEVAARLIDHAAALEALGEVEIAGLERPRRCFHLLDVAPVAPAFERRSDAPLVGRKRQLAAIRKSLKAAIDTDSVQVVLVTGPPGIGKSRLAAEIAGRAKGVTSLGGRCLSYGDGITYWPLREVLEGAPESDEREAVLAALDAGSPPPAPEIAWLFRRFCEAAARERPLVVAFDDVHWAEPTFLELVEHLAERGEGPILVLCSGREELLEDHPTFLEACPNVVRIALDALSADQTDALLEGLGGSVLESDQRARVQEAAEGNPFFLEQLLALALEGGLAPHAVPETVQALLAARLDRLGPGERAVLERGAVIGKEFGLEDVVALLEPDAAPTAEVHVQGLSARGFLRPAGPGGLRFRHLLVQEAVYRSAPKRLRAELHERFVDRFEERGESSPELDEFAGYHLEQAYRLRVELGESDRRTERLAEDAGHRLGEAGVRALKRGDMHATVSLLGRAVSLLPADAPPRRELQCELGIALRTSGDAAGAADVLAAAVQSARDAADRRIEARARVEHEYVQLLAGSARPGDALADATAAAIPVLQTLGDDRSLGRAWLLAGFVRGGYRGDHAAWLEAAEHALVHYVRSGWPTSTCLGEITTALYYGPTPVREAIARCEELLREQVSDRAGEANVAAVFGGLVAQLGELDEARARVAAARATFEDLGQRSAAANVADTILGDVELLAGDARAAARVLGELCAELEATSDWSHLASRSSDLAEALYRDGQLDEAERWTQVAERHAPADDLDAQAHWRSVRAKVHAQRGDHDVAVELARRAARILEASDGLNRRARAQHDLGEVLRLGGRTRDAAQAFAEAVALYERRGNLVAAARVRELLDDGVLV